jgi:quinol monooxygenase YgiN
MATSGGNAAGMFLVTMEARVTPELEKRLTRAYDHEMSHRPPGVVQTMLMRDAHDLLIWRIVPIWDSHEALEAHYTSGALMPSASIFHLIELTPHSAASEIIANDATVSVRQRHQQNGQNGAVS